MATRKFRFSSWKFVVKHFPQLIKGKNSGTNKIKNEPVQNNYKTR